jgi:hypothetical protein
MKKYIIIAVILFIFWQLFKRKLMDILFDRAMSGARWTFKSV